jgi:hypothetical protein
MSLPFTTTCSTEREFQPANVREFGATSGIRSFGGRTLLTLFDAFGSTLEARGLIVERWNGSTKSATRYDTSIRWSSARRDP